jgi:hypothetical protein
MQMFLKCIPCFVQQMTSVLDLATGDVALKRRVFSAVLAELSRADYAESPPAVAARVHRMVREMTGNPDPYAPLKREANELAIDLLPALRADVDAARDKLAAAVAFSIAGNVIDYGIQGHVPGGDVRAAIEQAADVPLDASALERLRSEIAAAGRILVLGDNTGEIVLDRLLLEQLPLDRTIYVVRGGCVLNDATLDDARAVGIAEMVRVIDNGHDAPGTVLRECSEPFRHAFDAADLVIAKGQGNFETLSDVPKTMVFVLKGKCTAVCSALGCEVGAAMVLWQDELDQRALVEAARTTRA